MPGMKTPTVRMAKINRTRGNQIGCPSAFRDVFKCKTSKYVYKFVRPSRWEVSQQSNSREYANYLKMKEILILPDGVKLPEMHLLADGTIAAQYIKGVHPQYTGCNESSHHNKNCPGIESCWATKIIPLGLRDVHHQNVLIAADGTIYIIDLDGGFAGD